jgi:hypothetical protein
MGRCQMESTEQLDSLESRARDVQPGAAVRTAGNIEIVYNYPWHVYTFNKW